MQNAAPAHSEATPTSLVHSVRHEIRMHSRTVFDIHAAAKRVAQRHKCRSDMLIQNALLKEGMRKQVVMLL